MTTEIVFMSAVEIARLLRSKALSAREVLQAHLAQIERVNPSVNAIVTLAAERAMQGALAADEALAHGALPGPLHGLPIAHKDLQDTAGIRTTYGSPIFADNVPARDTLTVERLKAAGAITLGKTNTPEFGAGSQTFNPVFGATRNPYDLGKTCGGSSGGAAVALATGMLPIADGSDMGGSLRNPASFCNVVGMRPSPGRVPSWPTALPWFTLSVDGPMARSVADVALLLSAMAGPDPRAPLSIEQPGAQFSRSLARDLKGVRVAWLRDVPGLRFEPEVREVVDAQRATLEALGCIVEEAQPPGLGDADEIFKTLRAWSFELGLSDVVQQQRERVKDTVIWNVEAGMRLTGPQISRAERNRGELFQRMRVFMERYEFMVLPTCQVAPFDIDQPYVREIDGEAMTTYIDWMRSCYYITVLGSPAISVPCGFTAAGLPVGLQIVGRHHDDFGILQLAHAFEQATGFGARRPAVAARGV